MKCFNFFGLIYLSFLKMGREQLRRRLSRLQWLIFLMKAHLLTFGLVVHLFRRFRVCNKPHTLYTLHDISKLPELSHSKCMYYFSVLSKRRYNSHHRTDLANNIMILNLYKIFLTITWVIFFWPYSKLTLHSFQSII